MRGTKPSCIAWRVTEKAPEMTAWDAMTVARVASAIKDERPIGAAEIEGFLAALRVS